jgi:protein TonB
MTSALPPPVRNPRPRQRARVGSLAWPYRRRIWLAALLATAIHALFYLLGGRAIETGVEFGMEDESPAVSVELVEQAAPEAAVPPPPVPEPPQPEPVKPEPVPEPQKPEPQKPEPKSEEMIAPKPEPAPTPKPVAPSPPARPRHSARSAAIARSSAPAGSSAGASGGSSGARTTGPGYLSNPKPPYPAESREAHEQGTVVLRVFVEPSGRPGSVTLARSSGYPRLDRAALEAVRRWRFKPVMRDGQAFGTTVDVPVRFTLR